MAITLPDARQLSDSVLEALRVRAINGRELGFTEADLANLLGVSRETICRWWSAYTAHGLDALPQERTGPSPRLGTTPLRPAGQQRPTTPGREKTRRPGYPRTAVEPSRRP